MTTKPNQPTSQPVNQPKPATSQPVAAVAAAPAKGKKGRKHVPENETGAEKFRRLGSPRMLKAKKAITAIGNLSGAQYEWTEAQKTQIITDLRKWVNETESRFRPHVKAEKEQEVYSL